MKHGETEHLEPRLQAILREARPDPELPPRFHESVWRRIECEEVGSEAVRSQHWLDQWVTLIVSPRLAMAGAAVMLLLGGILGVMDGSAAARQAARDQYVASIAPHVSP
jgi:hypothetical protein